MTIFVLPLVPFVLVTHSGKDEELKNTWIHLPLCTTQIGDTRALHHIFYEYSVKTLKKLDNYQQQ
jgi:hypothetical protein